jgi:hypothetical protein
VAQLPYLIYGQAVPMSSEAFKELATSLMSKRDAELLKTLRLEFWPPEDTDEQDSYAKAAKPSGSSFIDQWREWERVLRLNLAKLRSLKIRPEGATPAEPPAIPTDAAVTAAKAIAASESPLEAEVFIDRARWNAIESFQGNDYFGHNTIFAYLLKLLILERRASFQAETGFSEYKSLYASILENAQAGVLAAGESK